MLVYPLSGPGAVNVTRGDLKRLEPNQYLNDVLIEFGLKYVFHRSLVAVVLIPYAQVMAFGTTREQSRTGRPNPHIQLLLL